MRYVLLVLQVALFLPYGGYASNGVLLPEPKISFSLKDALLKDVIWELEKQSGFVFAYNANDLRKFSKCRYRLRKSKLIVPTTASAPSATHCFAWMNPGVYS